MTATTDNSQRIRKSKTLRRNSWTSIANALCQSARLTGDAKAIAMLMFSLPDDWDYCKAWLRAQFDDDWQTGERPQCYMGRDKFNKAWNELQAEGWVLKTVRRAGDKTEEELEAEGLAVDEEKSGKFRAIEWELIVPDVDPRVFNRMRRKPAKQKASTGVLKNRTPVKPDSGKTVPNKELSSTKNSSSSYKSRVRARDENAELNPHRCTEENRFNAPNDWVDLVLENTCKTIECCAEGWYSKIRHDLKAKIREYWESYAIPGQVPSKADAEDYARKGVNHRYDLQGLDVVRWNFDDCPF